MILVKLKNNLNITRGIYSIVWIDLEEQNAFVKSSFDVGPKLHFRAAHDVKVSPFSCFFINLLAFHLYSSF